MSEQSQDEAIRELAEKRRQVFQERMRSEQAIRDEAMKKNPQQNPGRPPDDIDRCPHGVPLARSCPRCDVVQESDIKDRIPIQ